MHLDRDYRDIMKEKNFGIIEIEGEKIMASIKIKPCNTHPNGYYALKNFNLDIEDKEFHPYCRAVWMRKILNARK